MQQRQPRVGDIVDDYCPRERRVSDHAVVAMVGDDIRQTRCTTCDTEHEYRQAKVPPGRKKPTVLPPKPPAAMSSIPAPKLADSNPEPETPAGERPSVPAAAAADPVESDERAAPTSPEGPVHRRLIRAVLPRIEGEVPTRQAPEFTMHHAPPPRPTGHGRGPRPSQAAGGHARPGFKASGGQARFGERRGQGGPARSGHHAHGGHGGNHAGQPGHGGGRHGRPQQGGQGPRKRH